MSEYDYWNWRKHRYQEDPVVLGAPLDPLDLVGLVDPGAKRLIGIVTLHDLLRREVAITKEYTDDV